MAGVEMVKAPPQQNYFTTEAAAVKDSCPTTPAYLLPIPPARAMGVKNFSPAGSLYTAGLKCPWYHYHEARITLPQTGALRESCFGKS